MCGAFGVSTVENIYDQYQLNDSFGDWTGSYNIRPGQHAPIISKNSPLKGHFAHFGFVPSWSKEAKPKIMPINAKSETVATSGFFRSAFLHTRCLVPAEFWYEWKKIETSEGITKQPYAFRLKNTKMFSFAGIYSEREDAEKKKHFTFAIITTKPNDVTGKIHNRMPVVLTKKDEQIWLEKNRDGDDWKQLLNPIESDQIEVWKVSKAVGNSRNDGPELIKEIS